MNTTGQLYAKGNVRQVKSGTDLCNKYLEYLSPDDVILDIGCGSGEITKFLAAKSGADVTGIDTSHDMIQYARLNNNGANITYERVDVQVILKFYFNFKLFIFCY